MLAMTISHSLSLALTASILAAAWVMPAPAAELPAVPAVHKAANLATPARKTARQQSLVRIASAEWPPSADTGPRWFPIVLGVAY